ncbi:MAG: type II CAAX endopeptidase family protein [Bacteroidia bacterium]|nr:type II CAAX endopeptidase family protein [Bacteroidia bacterium]
MEKHRFINRAASGNNYWPLYLAVIVLLIIGNVIVSIPASFILMKLGVNPADLQNMDSINPEDLGIHPALGLAVLILPFVISIPVLAFGVKYIHQRPFLSMISPVDKIDWKRFFTAMGFWLALMGGFEMVAYLTEPENYTWNFDAGKFFPTLLVVLLLIPLQTSLEELLFRGYLLQGFGLWFKRPWATILMTSTLFGLLHIANPEISKFGYGILLYYIGFGVIMAVITIMDERMEIALGVHAGNNIYGASVVTFSGSALQTPTLFTMQEYHLGLMTGIWLVASAIFVVVMMRKYNWQDWGKLVEKIAIIPPETISHLEDMGANDSYPSANNSA